MTKNIRSKVKRFLTSEVGRTTLRAPLALGVTSGTFLLSQMVHTPAADALIKCDSDAECGTGGKCEPICVEWDSGTCTDIEFGCLYSDS